MPHKQLKTDWKKARPEYCFCNDGILNLQKYNSAPCKLAFLLKESNDDFVDIAPCYQGYDPAKGNSTLFWRAINIIKHRCYCIAKNDNTAFEQIKNAIVDDIAYINIKKNCENKPKSSDNEIYAYGEKDRDFLIQQLEIINPKIVVCCGNIVAQIYKDFLGDLKLLNECKSQVFYFDKKNNRFILQTQHPSACVSLEERNNDLQKLFSAEKVLKKYFAL